MFKYFKKHRTFIAIILLSILLTTFLFLPTQTQVVSMLMVLISIGIVTVIIFEKHWIAYQQAECTREKMIRNLALDLLGLLFTMGVAMYIGRLAGGYFGIHAGFWFGLFAGFLVGFVAAWVVRSIWGRLVALI